MMDTHRWSYVDEKWKAASEIASLDSVTKDLFRERCRCEICTSYCTCMINPATLGCLKRNEPNKWEALLYFETKRYIYPVTQT